MYRGLYWTIREKLLTTLLIFPAALCSSLTIAVIFLKTSGRLSVRMVTPQWFFMDYLTTENGLSRIYMSNAGDLHYGTISYCWYSLNPKINTAALYYKLYRSQSTRITLFSINYSGLKSCKTVLLLWTLCEVPFFYIQSILFCNRMYTALSRHSLRSAKCVERHFSFSVLTYPSRVFLYSLLLE